MVYPLLCGRAPDEDSGAIFQGGTAALHGTDCRTRSNISLDIEGVLDDNIMQTFDIDSGPTVIARLAQYGFVSARSAKYNPLGVDTQRFINRKRSFI